MAKPAVRTTPAIRENVLKAYKSGKATSATALSKEFGISRSAVYRILSSVPKDMNQETDGASVSSAKSKVSDNFFYRVDRFADDLGLPTETKPPHAEDRPQVDEDEMEGLLGAMLGSSREDAQPESQLLRELRELPRQQQPMQEDVHTVLRPIVPRVHIDRQDVIQRIIFNVQHFSPLLITITGKDVPAFLASLGDRSTQELQHLVETIERTRSVGTISSGFKQVFYITAEGVEVGSGLIGVKSDGFTAQLREQDEAITMCLKEIALAEWERLKGLDSPYARLGILFSLTLAQTHSKNTMSEHLKQVREAQVPPATVEKHADL